MVAKGAFWVLALYCVVQQIFVYNFAVGNVGHIPMLAGGYIYLACLVGLAFLLRLGRFQYSLRIEPDVAVAMAFLVLATVIVLRGEDTARRYHDAAGVDVTLANMRYLASHALAFAVGYSLKGLDRFKALIVAGFVALSANVFMNIDPITVLINLKVSSESFSGIYLLMGDAYGLWALLACAVVESRRAHVLLVGTSLVCLLLIGTRTALYSFIVVMPLVFKLSGVRATVLMVAIVALALGLSPLLADTEGLASRMLVSLITGEDSSLNSRAEQFDAGLRAISDHWLLGDYAGQVRDFGDFGAYLHNVLSYWRQFGLLAFVMIIMLWGRASLLAVRCWRSGDGRASADVRCFVFLVAFFGIESLTSRSYGYSLPWVALGLGASLASSFGRRLSWYPGVKQ